MSKADKMFEEMDYKKDECSFYIDYIGYFNGHKRHIFFDKEFRSYSINDYKNTPYITIEKSFKNKQEKDAIMMKMKELGWKNE